MPSAMPSAPLVSIIIPAYNYAHYLPLTLTNALQQGLARQEIILIDDGSTDHTRAVAAQFPGVRYIYQENAGLPAARNRGIHAAHGDYLVFLDADDLLARGALAKRLHYLLGLRMPGLCLSPTYRFTLTVGSWPLVTGKWLLPGSHPEVNLCRGNIAPPHAFMVHRHVVEQVGDFDTRLRACEDYDYWFRSIVTGAKLHVVPVGSAYYRMHSTSMSANRENQTRHDAIMQTRILHHLLTDADFPAERVVSGRLAALTGGLRALATRTKLDLTTSPELAIAITALCEQIVQLREDCDNTTISHWLATYEATLTTPNAPTIVHNTVITVGNRLGISTGRLMAILHGLKQVCDPAPQGLLGRYRGLKATANITAALLRRGTAAPLA